jgi:bifunctional non-homologous end joining protein LigD
MGLDPMPVTSGSKGIHLYAGLDGNQTSDEVSAVAHELARVLEADHPDLIVSDMKKSLRSGKVLVDWSQNNGNKTTVVPYSLRGRSHPMVAAPRTWRELASPSLRHLDYREVLTRVERKGDVLEAVRSGDAGALAQPARDRLTVYRSKRDASKTPEPIPDEASASDGNTFVIQEHHASRLHWDFRLEHDGVLVSWALPKGVPTESGTNHLAVQTEDHPIEYGGFAGDIPQGEYGAGHVEIWDSGDYELEKWRDGEEVIAVLHGAQHGTHRYALIHTHDDQWLIHLTKEQPSPSESSAAQPRRRTGSAEVKAMLATTGDPDSFHDTSEWAFEMKWDGIRLLSRVEHGTFSATTRNGHDVTASYPELADLLRAVTVDVVLDGEVVALDDAGRPDFGRLQQRSGLTASRDIERERSHTPVQLFVFDILEKEGHSLRAKSYDERRRILESTVRSTGSVHVPPAFDGDLEGAWASSAKLGLEGVMAKRHDSTYVGRRSSDWVKLKHHRTQEVVVAGWRPGKGARADRIGSLLLGIPAKDGLHYVGRVGTGFSDRALDDALAKLGRLARKTTPLTDVPAVDARDARWVRPELVGEVEFAEWTSSGRLRQPRWRGWRADKSAAEVTRES